MKILINEKQFHTLLMLERLSHSDEVEDAAESLLEMIINNSKNQKWVLTSDNTYVLSNCFESDLFGFKFTICYNIHILNASTKEIKQSVCNMIDKDNNFLTLELYIDNGKLVSNLFQDTIYHELHHIYQKSKLNGKSMIKNEELYSKAIKMLQTCDKNTIEYKLAIIIYFGNRIEQDAFIQGSFGAVKHNISNNGSVKKYFTNFTLSNDKLNYLKHIYKELKLNSDNDEWKNACRNFNKPISWFVRRLRHTIKRFQNKISHIDNYINQEL